ncbi:MAG TPA: hypothetical protein VNK04_21035 [Gemmataceae bacterium]|nr:hypothetical protein [Gemmataceae bacterium]
MTLEQLVQRVETRLCTLGKRLWNDPMAELREEADRLAEDLQRSYAELEQSRSEKEALAQRVAAGEVNAAMLVSQIETYVHVGDQANAWRQALELDRVRQALNRDQVRLALQEAACRKHQARIAQLEGRLTDLLGRLYPT